MFSKPFAFTVFLVASLAFAANYASYQEIQLGPSVNQGTTRARPISATEGISCAIPATFSTPYATSARVTVSTVGLNADAGQAQWWSSSNSPAGPIGNLLIQGWELGLAALNDGGSVTTWVREFAIDATQAVDGGVDQQSVTFEIAKLPPCSSTTRFVWGCSNCYSTGTNTDAGATVTVELFAP